jgi:small-conductance mechanosensitive channel
VLVALGAYLLMVIWDWDATTWLASAGIIGIALGFAAQDTLGNLFAGIFIIADKPYQVGDYVVLDTGERGEVVHIGLRSTRLVTRDDVEITVPNAVMGNAKIVNESRGPWRKERIRIAVSVAYGSDIDVVRDALMKVAREESDVCAEPEPRVRFRAFGGSGLEFELLVWIEEAWMRGRATDALNGAVYKGFAAAGIEIPYSKHDVYVKGWPSPPPDAG